ncbi:hypothetical protein [Chitinimonas koreensis]|uniref:hypothetical protein n=1 Tax=Chitinimonas koreensis TaxID=356302 RepID=UPI001654A563|nr:hypothetical protein [Chitinimonas koreensis]QNM96516.1 hypothetical protein H9L41_22565 [Chitinimonas koreensis]
MSQWGRDSRTDKKPDIPNLAWTANGIAITDGSLAAYRHDLAVPVGKQIDDLVDSVDGFLTNPNHYLQHAVGKSGHDLSSTVTVDLALRAAAQAATFAANVQVRSARISYWIETVHGGPDRMVVARQLLYSQTVTLSIDGKDYDQVTVGVLLKDAESAPPASQASQASRRR